MENFNDTLASIENALKENTINEGQYIKLMNLAKKRFDKQNEIEDKDEKVVIALESHGDILLAQYENIHHGNYVVINLIEGDETILYRKFDRLSDAEVYYKELAGI